MGVYVSLSTMDKWWYEDMDKREGVDLLRKCIDETEKRESKLPQGAVCASQLLKYLSGLTIKFDFNCILIDKNGIHKVDLSQADPIANIQEHPQETEVEAPHPPIEVGISA